MAGEREQFRAALTDLVLERGCEAVTVEMAIERAGLERGVFDRHFADLSDCLLDAYLAYSGDFDRRVFGAFEAEEGWRDGMRAAAYAAARFVRDRPREIRFGAVALLQAGPVIQAHRANHLQRLVDLVDGARQELDDPDSLNRAVAEGVLGSINETVVRQLQSGNVRAPEDYVPELLYIAVRPYFGHEAAREELEMRSSLKVGDDG